MNARFALGTLLLPAALALPVRADESAAAACSTVQGNFNEYVVDTRLSTFDPFGRVVTFTDGTITSVGTAILTSVGPGPSPGTLQATTRHLFILNQNDQITATGMAIFTPIPDTADVHDVLTLKIIGGTGRFEKATGQIVATGRGFGFFPLPPGPIAGSTFFVFTYQGTVCVP